MRAVGLDVLDRAVEPVDNAHGDDRIEIFGAPIRIGCGYDERIDVKRLRVTAHRAAGLEQ